MGYIEVEIVKDNLKIMYYYITPSYNISFDANKKYIVFSYMQRTEYNFIVWISFIFVETL